MKEIIIIGRGKLAQSFFSHFKDYSAIPLKKYGSDISSDSNSIYVHLGSGRQYKESLKKAIDSGASYIQAATEKAYEMQLPSQNSIKYIEVPNLDIKIIKLLYCLESSRGMFGNEAISIIESHQKEKQSQPGTAYKFCEYLNIPRENLLRIRDPDKQKHLDIQNLEHHAYHKIQIGDDDSNITIETKVQGSISYVKGLARIVECIPKLLDGCYNITDLVSLRLI